MISAVLQADPAASTAYRERLRTLSGGRPAIGLSWRSGNAAYGAQKSLALADLAPLIRQRADLFWVDLQYGDTAAERAFSGVDLWRDPGIDPLHDLDAAASQYAALDLVITCSNTAVHLAGALGRPAWLLLPAPGFGLLWYWQTRREDNPFYPSVRCFRQERAGDWSGVLAQVAAALEDRFHPNP
ncbi:MAG: hypothetical protein VW600_16840 [Ferrovibrio sp.]